MCESEDILEYIVSDEMIGKWVFIHNKTLTVAKSAKDAYKQAKKLYPNEEPFIIQVPDYHKKYLL